MYLNLVVLQKRFYISNQILLVEYALERLEANDSAAYLFSRC